MSNLKTLAKVLHKHDVPMLRTKSGYLIKTPDGSLVAIHVTESDHRALANTIARLKRHGLDVEPLMKGK
jgi:hypothetical protein